ncbi:bifunctional diguanylate cyclase/phosphodiesterase [Pelomicrobium sp. G1]|uniref:bifunctional diguanylate cyclase/phosphodiesterase n=1 Tax=unclassified Pelomicrobium TaxID=2815318 RepID=UPI003F768C6F
MMTLSPAVRDALLNLGVATAYFGLAELARALLSAPVPASTVWPAAGLALAAVAHFGAKLLPGVFVGALAAALSAGVSPATAAAFAAGAALAPAAGGRLLRRYGLTRATFKRLENVMALLAITVAVAAIPATAGTLALTVFDPERLSSIAPLWAVWWMGEAMGILGVTPLLLSGTRAPQPRLTPRHAVEATALLIAQVTLTAAAFDGGIADHGAAIALASFVFPLMAWSALRLPPPFAYLGAVLAAAAAVWGTSQGNGPFAAEPVWLGLTYLNVPVAALLLMCQLLAATSVQRRESLEALARSEEKFRALVQNSKDIITIHDPDGRTLYESPSAERILGYGPGGLIGKNPFSIIHPREANAAREAFLRLVQSRDAEFSMELRYRKADGTWIYLETVGVNRLHYPGINGIVLTSRDVTERKLAEQALKASEQRYMLAMEGASDGMWEIDTVTKAIYVSPRLRSMLGHPEGTITTLAAWEELIHPEDQEVYRRALSEHVSGASPHLECEFRVRTADGEYRWVFCRGKAARDRYGKALRMAGSVIDITERKRAEARIEHLATRDPLTALPNRVLLHDRLQQHLIGCQRSGTSLALLFIDLDRFKTINDSLGHHVGDELLKQVAQRLEKCVRRDDTLARLGGDEFVVVLAGIREETDAAQVAQKLLRNLAEPYFIQGRQLATTASIGIAIHPYDGQDIATLMKNADTAMYHAKERGRNTYQFFSSDMTARALQRLTVENDLRQALERNELVLHFQPQVNVMTGEVEGAEALLRWRHPEKGLVLPTRFIQIAEETGLIVPIGEWVLRAACAQCKAWNLAGYPHLRVSVNLSVGQFVRHADLPRAVTRALRDARLDPGQLELEITESLLVQNTEEHVATLQKLGRLGTSISVDDFGTGYSSLSYLKRLPIDALKIDRSFVRDLEADPDDAAIVRAVVALARSLRLKVVAEGVETQGQLDALRRLECDLYQGYLFSKPLPATEFEARFLRPIPLPFAADPGA